MTKEKTETKEATPNGQEIARSVSNDLLSLFALRHRLFEYIAKALAEDGHCKSYEGSMAVQFPNYFEERASDPQFTVCLDCYVIGPSRHYSWSGATLSEAIEKAATDINAWCDEWDREFEVE